MLTTPQVADATEAPSSGPRPPLIRPGYMVGFMLVTSLFLLWALANNLNDILIRQFQKALDLNRTQAGVIQFAFYMGYFVMALPAGLLMRRFGYRAGILAGLALYAAGAVLFYPAAEMRVYAVFLFALFVLASGAAFLETAANPFIVAFGSPERASQRLNLAQAFNGVGAVIAPTLGGLFIFSGVEHNASALAAMSSAQIAAFRASEARMVQMPYLVLGGIVLLVLVAIAVVRLPAPATDDRQHVAGDWRKLFRAPGLMGAVAAQFVYCGAQTGIWSFFVDFVKEQMPATPEKTAAYMLSASLVLLMVGRFVGAALMARFSATRLLMIYAIINVALCAGAVFLPGAAAVVALALTSFFMSIMFPTIFAQGVRHLGPLATLGSSFIIMAIIGGAVFPPLMGLVSSVGHSLQPAMLLPLLSFVAISVYARSQTRMSEH